MKKIIYYWGPFLDKVGTVRAIKNSSYSINYYSKKFKSYIINAVGEWDDEALCLDKKLNIINLKNHFYKNLPRYSYLKSRLSYSIIFFKCFFPLKNLLKKNEPNFLIAHLIVSLPMVLFIIFNFKTKLCLRISGKVKLNFLRKLLWKISSKYIYKIFCPSEETKKNLIEQKIFSENKFMVLYDPIIKIEEAVKLKNKKTFLTNNFKKDNIILVGRLTKQKNFGLFIKAFSKISKRFPNYQVNIFGEGELRLNLQKQINLLKLNHRVFLHGSVNNAFKYIKNSRILVLSSLWEDPGAVLMEAAFCNTLIISSDCESGPKEFLLNGRAGFLFKNDSEDSLILALENAINCPVFLRKEKLILAKKNLKLYTIFRHFRKLENYFLNI